MLKENVKILFLGKGLLVFLLISIFILMMSSSFAQKHLTIERLFSDPRLEGITPREIKWAKDGKKFAFLWNDKGERALSIWIYDKETKKIKEIVAVKDFEEEKEMTEEEKDRKTVMRKASVGITDYIWSPDDRKILIPYRADLFFYDIKKKIVERLTKTDKAELDPKFCGHSERITFARDNDLWLKDIEKKQTIQLTNTGSEKTLNGLSNYIALEELQRYSGYECSPDGEMIAYVQSDNSPIKELIIPDYLPRFVEYRRQERPVAGEKNAIEKVGIISSTGGDTTLIDIPLQDYYVLALDWYEEDLLLRIHERDNKTLHLFLYDVSDQSLKEILKEEDDKWINTYNNEMIPVREQNGILWTSERSGFNHIYFYDLKKNTLQPLTEGDWEVTQLHGMDKNGFVYFSATAIEPEQIHLFSYNYSNAQVRRLTSREGWHQVTFSPDFKDFTDLYSSETMPPQLRLFNVNGEEKKEMILDVSDPELSNYELASIEYFTVKSRDGQEIHCKMFKPLDLQDTKRYPVITYVHGGGYAQSVRKQWRGIAHLFHHFLAQELKYIIVDVDYRGSSGYGRNWRTDVYLHLGGKDLEDVLDVVEHMRKLPFIDPENMGIWGWSYGGFLTNMALLKTPDVFKAGAAVAPVNDWKNYDTQYTEERLSTPQDAPEAYERSSPISYAKNLKNHLFMIHGVKDDNVHFQDTVQLINQLIDYKIDFDLMIYPEGTHGIGKDSNRIHLFNKITQHFERYLK